MKHLSKFNGLLVALALTLVLAVGGSAYAQNGADDGTSSSGNSSSGSSSSGRSGQTSVATETEQATETETETQHGVTATTVKNKTENKVRSAESRQKACVAHKQGLTNKFNHIVTNSQRIDDRITEVLNKAVAYHDDKNVTVENWDDLVSKANAAGTSAADAITALKQVQPSIDCNSTSVASDVAAFKEQAGKTRDSLKDYRKAVKAVIKALLTAKQEANAAEGSDQ